MGTDFISLSEAHLRFGGSACAPTGQEERKRGVAAGRAARGEKNCDVIRQ